MDQHLQNTLMLLKAICSDRVLKGCVFQNESTFVFSNDRSSDPPVKLILNLVFEVLIVINK